MHNYRCYYYQFCRINSFQLPAINNYSLNIKHKLKHYLQLIKIIDLSLINIWPKSNSKNVQLTKQRDKVNRYEKFASIDHYCLFRLQCQLRLDKVIYNVLFICYEHCEQPSCYFLQSSGVLPHA